MPGADGGGDTGGARGGGLGDGKEDCEVEVNRRLGIVVLVGSLL